MAHESTDRHARQAEAEAERHRQIQREQERIDESHGDEDESEDDGSPDTSARNHPESPLPAQHQEKPGREADLKPRPQYEAPLYRGSGKLEGMVALITGADSGIGRGVAVLFAREGADVAIVYLSEHEDAEETRRAVEKEGQRALLIPGDVTDSAFCQEAVEKTVSEFG